MTNSLILKSAKELKENEKEIEKFLSSPNKSFWLQHFKVKKYKLPKKKLIWEEFSLVPFIDKSEILKLGLNLRLKDSVNIFKSNPRHFLLQSTSGTSKATAPVLFLKNVDEMIEGEGHRQGKKMLILYQARAIALRDTIAMINRNEGKNDNYQSLVINPFGFTASKIRAVKEFAADSIVTFPACITFLISQFPKSYSLFAQVKHVFLSGDFISTLQLSNSKQALSQKNATIDIDYLTTEADAIGICCKYLRKKYGTNAYHPFKDRLVELIDIDSNGFGEVVVTKLKPIELSILRYKTGDIARGLNTKCNCGKEWTLFLEGRNNMDYIKSLGTLIARAEIERVIKTIPQIVAWRGEVREVKSKKALLGELTLILQLQNHQNLDVLSKKISNSLLLTPKKTLANLVEKKNFMPLKLKLVDKFPPSTKNVPLKKIIN